MSRTLDAAMSRGEAIVFTLDRRAFAWTPPASSVPYLSLILDGGDGKDVLDFLRSGLRSGDMKVLRARLADPEDDLDFDVLSAVVRSLVSEVAGRPWENLVHLTAAAAASWEDIDGDTPLDLTEGPFDRLCNRVWRMFTKNMDATERAKFEAKVNLPIDGIEPSSEVWSDDATADVFMSFASRNGMDVDPDGYLKGGD